MAFRRGYNGGGKAADIGPSTATRQVTSFPTDLTTLLPGVNLAASRQMIVSNVGAGTKSLVYTGIDGVQVTVDATNLQGVTLPIVAKSLDAATTVTSVLVFF